MGKPVGQEEDTAAFEELYARYRDEYGTLILLADEEKRGLRFAFDAGMKRGLEKRGCCETGQ